MSKLYPPAIAGTLPAFYDNVISIPFEMNRAVSRGEVYGFSLKIKTVQTSSFIGTVEVTINDKIFKENIVNFTINNIANKLNVGQYYKVQMAYTDNTGLVGHYSSVGVIKYTSKPQVSIEGLNTDINNGHRYQYVGIYSQEGEAGDATEKLYSYAYELFDNNYQIIMKSDDIIYNSIEDDLPNRATFSFKINRELDQDKKYYLRVKTITSNKMEIYSSYYPLTQRHTINSDAKMHLEVDVISALEDGGIKINLVGEVNAETGIEEFVVGSFRLMRSDEKTNFTEWEDICEFNLYDQQPTQTLYIDYTVEQGVNYKYAIVQYNQYNLISNRIESESVYSDFEHMYLYDGERQLAIKYNPKVASFKEAVMEQKTNTIGSKYPFIFKNGNVGSKEFSISGLISLQMDENFLFTTGNKNTITNDYRSSTKNKKLTSYFENYNAYNIQGERDFKLEVLNWLNNGEPKLFRSSTEGNYIVRLINTSLSPNDQLARRLHTFSSTACEIDEVSFEKLKFYNILPNINISKKSVGWATVDQIIPNVNLIRYKAKALKFEGMVPGEKIYIDDGIVRNSSSPIKTTGFTITIGATGQYELELDSNIEITEVVLKSDHLDSIRRHQGTLTYAYDITTFNKFDTIRQMEIIDIPAQQFFGPQVDNLYDDINNIKINLQKIYYIHAILLPMKEEEEEQSNSWSPRDTALYLDGKEIDLTETKDYLLLAPDIKQIQFGKRVMLEMGYQISQSTYGVEIDNPSGEQRAYEMALNGLQSNNNEEAIKNVKEKYKAYLTALERQLKEQELIKGELV